jgi:serine/threonine-protein kinase
MGEVYRAEDTNLSRQVAIKVLPDEFARDTDRVARLQRDTKLLALLSQFESVSYSTVAIVNAE